MHRIGIECQASAVAEPMRLLQYPLDVRQRHRPVPHALGPAMPAHRRTARNLHVHRQQRHRAQIARPATGRHSFAHPRIIDQPVPVTPHPFLPLAANSRTWPDRRQGPRPTHAAATDQSVVAPRPANVSSQRASKMEGPGSASTLLHERGQQGWRVAGRNTSTGSGQASRSAGSGSGVNSQGNSASLIEIRLYVLYNRDVLILFEREAARASRTGPAPRARRRGARQLPALARRQERTASPAAGILPMTGTPARHCSPRTPARARTRGRRKDRRRACSCACPPDPRTCPVSPMAPPPLRSRRARC